MRVESDPSRPRPPDDHGAQGRPAPADRHRGRPRARSSTSTTCPRGRASKSQRGPDDRGRHAAGQDAARGRRHAGHHRRSAARHRDLRGPPAEGAGGHRRDRRPRRAARARSAAASGRSSSATRAASSASTSCRTASTSASTAATASGPATPLVDGPLVPHDILRISRRGGGAAATCSARCRTSTARQRVEIDDKHIEIIVAQMLRKVRVETRRRHRPPARLGHRQVRVPRVNEPSCMDCVKIKDPGDTEFEPGRHRPQATRFDAGEPPRRGGRRQEAPSGSGPSRPRPARSCWASPRRPCSPTASSRPRASRRRPRCSPRRPWPARSTTWSA